MITLRNKLVLVLLAGLTIFGQVPVWMHVSVCKGHNHASVDPDEFPQAIDCESCCGCSSDEGSGSSGNNVTCEDDASHPEESCPSDSKHNVPHEEHCVYCQAFAAPAYADWVAQQVASCPLFEAGKLLLTDDQAVVFVSFRHSGRGPPSPARPFC